MSGTALRMHTREDLYQLHLATVEVLSEVGIYAGSEDALKTFEKGGVPC